MYILLNLYIISFKNISAHSSNKSKHSYVLTNDRTALSDGQLTRVDDNNNNLLINSKFASRIYINLYDISNGIYNQVQNKCKSLLNSTSCTGTDLIEVAPKAPCHTSTTFGELKRVFVAGPIGVNLSHGPNESSAFPSNEDPEVLNQLAPPASPFSVDDFSFVDQMKEE